MTDEELTAWRVYAAAALQGCYAYSNHNETLGDFHNNVSKQGLARYAAETADAMLAEEHKRKNDNATR